VFFASAKTPTYTVGFLGLLKILVKKGSKNHSKMVHFWTLFGGSEGVQNPNVRSLSCTFRILEQNHPFWSKKHPFWSKNGVILGVHFWRGIFTLPSRGAAKMPRYLPKRGPKTAQNRGLIYNILWGIH